MLSKICVLLGLLVLLGQPAWAEDEVDFMAPFEENLTDKITKANGECLGCHSQEGLRNPPRAGMDLGKLAKLLVDKDAYDHSGHNGIDCRDCHNKGFAAYPHGGEDGEKPATKFCGSCHTRTFPGVEAEFKRSIHHEKWPDTFPCETCHNPHVYQSARKIGSARKVVAQDNGFCIDCHKSPERFRKFSPDKSPPDLDKVHSWLPNPPMHWKAVRCVDCHTPVGKPQSHEVLKKDKAVKLCAECHNSDSILRERLYRHLVEDEPGRVDGLGFVNRAILNEAYVVGATRNLWLDRASFVILGLALAGLSLHAVIRVLTRGKKK